MIRNLRVVRKPETSEVFQINNNKPSFCTLKLDYHLTDTAATKKISASNLNERCSSQKQIAIKVSELEQMYEILLLQQQ